MVKSCCVILRPSRYQSMSWSRFSPSGNAACRIRGILCDSGHRRLADGHFDDAERRTLFEIRREQRHGHVVDRHVSLRASFERAAMRVTVEDGAAAIAIDRLFESRRSEK